MAYFDFVASLTAKRKRQDDAYASPGKQDAPATKPAGTTEPSPTTEIKPISPRPVMSQEARENAIRGFQKAEADSFRRIANRQDYPEVAGLLQRGRGWARAGLKTDPSAQPRVIGLGPGDRGMQFPVPDVEEFYHRAYAIGEKYNDEGLKADARSGLESLTLRKKLSEISPELVGAAEKGEMLKEAEQRLGEMKARLGELESDPLRMAPEEAQRLKNHIPILENSVKRLSEQSKALKIGGVAEDLLDRDELRDFLKARVRDGTADDSAVKPLLNPDESPKKTSTPGLMVFRELQMMGPVWGAAASMAGPAGIAPIAQIAGLYDRVKAKREQREKPQAKPGEPPTTVERDDEDEKLYDNLQKVFAHPEMKFIHTAWFFALTVLAAGIEAAVNIHLASFRGGGHSNGVANLVRGLMAEERQAKQAAYQSYLREREFRLRALESGRREQRRQFMDEISLARLDLMRQRLQQHERLALARGKEEYGDPLSEKLFAEYSRKESKAASIAKQLSDPLLSEGLTKDEQDSLRSQMIRLRVESDAIFEDYQARLKQLATGQPNK